MMVAVLLGGCGKSGLVSVSGTVTLDGKPLQTGSVSFQPVGEGPMGYGTIRSDGTYTVYTGTQEGLPPGEYRVTVVATGPMPEPTPQNPEPLPQSLIPLKYGSAKTSGLTFTAGSSQGRFDIALTSQ